MRLQSDDRLAELAIDGHDAAFTAIVDRYRTPLLRYCAGIVGPSRAEDAVQQVLINAHDAFTRTNEVRHLRSWLYRIAHNTSLNVLRAVRDDLPLDPAQATATGGPAAAFEQSERLRATLDAVRELPERQRAALVLRELEGRSHEEIADALGVTKGSARQHLMRARTAVRSAVTAITPYPLIAKLAEAVSSPASGSWADAAVGAGAGATVMKLTAGVMATGAIVGGAVGTDQVIHRRHQQAEAASTQTIRTAPARRVRVAAPATATTENAALTQPAPTAPRKGTSGASGRGTGASPDTRKGGDDRGDDDGGRRSGAAVGGGSGSSGGGSDDSDDDSSDRHDTGTGKGSSGRGGESGEGSSGSGKDDNSDDRRETRSGESGKRSGSGSGSSGSGSSGSGSSGSVSADDDTTPTTSSSTGSGSAEAGDDLAAGRPPASPDSGSSPTSGSSGSGTSTSGDDGSSSSGSSSSGSSVKSPEDD
jgi:RNA polymerase sigma factor (sigma-70 family)